MNGNATSLKNPQNMSEKGREFFFDYSYWSHDGFKEISDGYMEPDNSHANGKKYADQKKVFNDLGNGVLQNTWEGYNSTLFAYGQTGSGKSYSVVGYGSNKGIVPLFCDKLFQGITEKRKSGNESSFEVTFSMIEIYMEQVRDLLDSKPKKAGGLDVRQHPNKGFYVDGLQVFPVASYSDIERKMDEGTTNRTVAATNMNATSSRAHTIVGITLVQKFKNSNGQDTTKSSIVNLVDLAGSERADSTGATGDRLKEGASINLSLSTLGNCIAALVERANGKDVAVPYRNSVLTKLLKNALGGNSKTTMVAAISPADVNYDETLSTLRYADRAKQIKTSAKVNESPTDKLIRELQEENEKLKKMIQAGGATLTKEESKGLSEEEKAALKAQIEADYKANLAQNAKEIEDMKLTFEQRLKDAQATSVGDIQKEIQEKKKKLAHIYNLNADIMLTGKIIHFIDKDKLIVGNGKAENTNIELKGPSIIQVHARFLIEGKKFFIEFGDASAKIFRNGELVKAKTELHHNDRLMFGATQLYIFCNPTERDASKKQYITYTFDMAQEEIAAFAGFDMTTENKSREEKLLMQDLIELLPAVAEANAISDELDENLDFEVILISPEALGELTGRTQAYVKVIDDETDIEWLWSREKFFNRKFLMQEMFQKFSAGEDWKMPPERDPFRDDPEDEWPIGSVKVWLKSLGYLLEVREQLEITDFKGQDVGLLNVELLPCDRKGRVYKEDDDVWVENPSDLIGRDLHFIVKISSARGLPSKYTDVYAKYVVFTETNYTKTNAIKNTSNPEWNHVKQYDFNSVTEQLVHFMESGAIMVQIWGKQKPTANKKKPPPSSTKIAAAQRPAASLAKAAATKPSVDTMKPRLMMELALAKRRNEKAELKLAQFREVLRLADHYGKSRLPSQLLKDLMSAQTPEVANRILSQIANLPADDDDPPHKGYTPLRANNASSMNNGTVEWHERVNQQQRQPRSSACIIQ